MASVNTVEVLNGILNCVTRIEKSLGVEGGGGAAAGGGGGIKAKISDLKGMGKEIGEIATGLIKMIRARKGLQVFNEFLDTSLRILDQYTNKDIIQATENFATFISTIEKLKVKNIMAFGLFVKTTKAATSGKDGGALGRLAVALGKWGEKNTVKGVTSFEKFLNVIRRTISLKAVAAFALFSIVAIPMALGLAALGLGMTVWGSESLTRGVKNMDKFGTGIKNLSIGVAIFALTMVAASAAMAATGIKAAGGMGVVAGAILLIAGSVAMFAIPIVSRGTRSIKNLGKGFIALSGGIAILALTIAAGGLLLKDVSLGGFMGGVGGVIGAVGALALVTALFGLGPVRKGAKSLKAIGLGMIAMAAGIALLGLAFCGIAALAGENFASTVGMMIISVIGIGVMMIILGKQLSKVALGAVAMLVMSVGLGIFSIGLGMAFKIMPKKGNKPDWEMLGFMAACIAGLGLEMGLIGIPVVAGFISLGALACAAMGVGLMSLSHGIKMWNESGAEKFKDKKYREICLSLKDTYLEFGAIESGKIMLASGAVTAIGLSLSVLAWGIGKWANLQNIPLIESYDADGKPIYGKDKVDIDKAIANIADVLSIESEHSVIKPFMQLAESGVVHRSDRGGLAGMLGAQADSDFEVGVQASRGIGNVLTSIAAGIGAFARLQGIPLMDYYDKDGIPHYSGKTADVDKAIANVADVLSMESEHSVLKPFADLAKTGVVHRNDRGGLSGLLGAQADSDFEVGVQASRGIGNVLTSVAAGIGAFAQLQGIPLMDYYDKDGIPHYSGKTADVDKAIANVADVLAMDSPHSVLKPFADLAATGTVHRSDRGGFMGLLGAQADSDFEVGVQASRGIGDVLTRLAEGIAAFAKLQGIPLIDYYDKDGKPVYSGKHADVDKAIANVATVLSFDSKYSVLKPFVDLAEKGVVNRSKKGGFLGLLGAQADSNFEVGIQASRGIGNVLTSLGAGIATFAELQNIKLIDYYDEKGIPHYSGESANIDLAIKNARMVLDPNGPQSIINPFIKLAEEQVIQRNESSGLLGLIGVQQSSDFEVGIQAARGIGDVLTGIGNGLLIFAQLESVPLIASYDKNGKPVYDGKTVNVFASFDNIQDVLTRMIGVFTDFVKNNQTLLERKPKEGLLGLIGVQADSPFEVGVQAAVSIGSFLSSTASGLKTFAELQNIKMIDHYDENGKPVYSKESFNIKKAVKNIGSVLDEVTSVFIPFGYTMKRMQEGANAEQKKNGGIKGWFKSVVGIDAETPFEKGLKAAVQVSEVLGPLADAFTTFKDIKAIPKITGYDEKGNPIYSPNETISLEQCISNIGAALEKAARMIGTSGVSIADSMAKITFKGLLSGKSFEEGLSDIAKGFIAFIKEMTVIEVKQETIDQTLNLARAMRHMSSATLAAGTMVRTWNKTEEEINGGGTKKRGVLGWLKNKMTGSEGQLTKKMMEVAGSMSSFAEEIVKVQGEEFRKNAQLFDSGFGTLSHTLKYIKKLALAFKGENEEAIGLDFNKLKFGEKMTYAGAGLAEFLPFMGKSILYYARKIEAFNGSHYLTNANQFAMGIERLYSAHAQRFDWEKNDYNRVNVYDDMTRITREFMIVRIPMASLNPHFAKFTATLIKMNQAINQMQPDRFLAMSKALKDFMSTFDGPGSSGSIENITVREEPKGFFGKAKAAIGGLFGKKPATTTQMVAHSGSWEPGKRFKFVADVLHQLSTDAAAISTTGKSVAMLGSGMTEFANAVNLISDNKWDILKDISVSLKDATAPDRVASLIEAINSLAKTITGAKTGEEGSSEETPNTSIETDTEESTPSAAPKAEGKPAAKGGNDISALLDEVRSLKSEIAGVKRALTNSTLSVRTVDGSIVETR